MQTQTFSIANRVSVTKIITLKLYEMYKLCIILYYNAYLFCYWSMGFRSIQQHLRFNYQDGYYKKRIIYNVIYYAFVYTTMVGYTCRSFKENTDCPELLIPLVGFRLKTLTFDFWGQSLFQFSTNPCGLILPS